MLQLSTNFKLYEFVPKEVYTVFGDRSIRFIDSRVPKMAQYIHDRYGHSVIINDWYSGGQYNESGFRVPDTKTGTRLSSHKRGTAIDIKVKGISALEIQQDLIANWSVMHQDSGITTIERGTPDWTHVSCEWVLTPYIPNIIEVGG